MIELLHNDIIPGVDYMAAESSERKKISTLYILEILKRYTDDTYDSEGRPLHCLTQAQIGEKLYADYGINLDRKAVSRALDDLYCSPEFCDKIVFDTVPRKAGEMKTNYRYIHDFDAGEIRMTIPEALTLTTRTLRYESGTAVKLTAVPYSGYQFDHWTVNDEEYTADTINFNMYSQTYDVKAPKRFLTTVAPSIIVRIIGTALVSFMTGTV